MERSGTKMREMLLNFEFKSLKTHGPTGCYILPQIDSLDHWHGVIFLR